MRVTEILAERVGRKAFAFSPQGGAIVPVTIIAKNYMGQEFKVSYAGSPPHSGNGGIWAASEDDLYNTEEEAQKVLFKAKLKGQR